MTWELLKVIVQPVTLERDDDGAPVGERIGEPVAIYTPSQLADYVQALRAELEKQNGV